MKALILALALLSAVNSTASEVVELQGDVTIERAGKNLDVAVGMQLVTGDTINTSANGRIAFMMPGNSLVTLGANTKLQIAESSEDKDNYASTINLLKGRLRSLIGGIFGRKVAFNIKTPNAVAGVRGTSVIYDVPEEPGAPETIFTLNGKVMVTHNNGTETMLTSGKGISVLPNGFGGSLTGSSPLINEMDHATSLPLTVPPRVVSSTVNQTISGANVPATVNQGATAAANGSSLIDSSDVIPHAPENVTINVKVNVQ